jgi:hypothetical protein
MEKKSAYDLIEIIGKLWPLVLTVFVIIVFIMKWKTIWNFIGSLTGIKIKKGETQIELSKGQGFEVIAQKSISGEIVKSESQELPTAETNDEAPTLFECYNKLEEGMLEEAIKLFNQIQLNAKPSESVKNEFTFLFYKYIFGKSDEKEFTKKLEEDITPEQRSIGYKYLGLSQKYAKQFPKAIGAFKMAIELTKSESEICTLISYISQSYLDDNASDESKKIILDYIPKLKEDSNKSDLYFQLSKVFDHLKDNFLKSIALEKASTLKGNDISYLFDSAYCYGETDFKEASISKYFNLLSLNNKHENALNNQGVNFQNLKLPLKSTEYYQKAVEVGSSLAASNLAYKFIDAGLADEATSLFKQFIEKPSPHKNLIMAQSKLLNELESQQNKANEFLELGNNYSRFFRKYGFHYFEDNSSEFLDDKWTDTSNNNITVQIKDCGLLISWEQPNSIIGSNDIFSITGQINSSACEIIFDFPTVKNPEYWELVVDKNKKPSRIIKKYSGYCYLDLTHSSIEILYKSDEGYKFKEITKKTCA